MIGSRYSTMTLSLEPGYVGKSWDGRIVFYYILKIFLKPRNLQFSHSRSEDCRWTTGTLRAVQHWGQLWLWTEIFQSEGLKFWENVSFTWQMSWLDGLMKVFSNKRTRIRIIGNKNCKINERGFLQQDYFSLIHNEFCNYNLFFRIQCFLTQRKKCLDIVNQWAIQYWHQVL